MAKVKNEPFRVFETEEDYGKCWEQAYEAGQKRGFHDGKIWTLSYVYDLLENLFSQAEWNEAAVEKHHRHIEEWRKDQEINNLKEKLELGKLFKNLNNMQP